MNISRIVLHRRELALSHLFLAGVGFVPIGCLCVALFGLISLPVGARYIVLPFSVIAVVVGAYYPRLGRRALLGLIAGVLATGVYDLVRLTFVLSGVWGDFIPAIGRMALGDSSASPFWGYVWRFGCNGGAMGMTFALLPWRGARPGMAYGVGICLCLFATLLLAPGAQEALFHLTPLTACTALLGHLIYGSVLGRLLYVWGRHSSKPSPDKTVMVDHSCATHDQGRSAPRAVVTHRP